MASRLEILRQLPDDYLRHLGKLSGQPGLDGMSRDDLIAVLAGTDPPSTEDALNGLSLADLQALATKLGIAGMFRAKKTAIQAILAAGSNPAPVPLPTPLTPPSPTESALSTTVLARLRSGTNPFVNQVTAVGTVEESLIAGVPEYTANQLAELLEIIGLYRTGAGRTRAYPLLGERGSGKTHLLYSLRAALRNRAAEAGEESLLVIVERLSPGMDAIDYLLWQIVNHLLASRGEGARMLGVIAGRLTSRLLGESLRAMPPTRKLELIPTSGFWSRLGVGASNRAEGKLAAIDTLVQRCDAKHPKPAELRAACDEAGVKPTIALKAIEDHLERTGSKDLVGWFHRELYVRLARVALLDDRVPFEDFHGGDFEDAPAHVAGAGNLGRRLLDTWLELLAVLHIPVVVLFDQLEDYLRHPNPEQQKLNRQFFTDATARFINELRNVCILTFAEQSLWTDLMNQAEAFTSERLTQPFTLPGRPAKSYLQMPDTVTTDILNRIIRQRLLTHFPDLDLTGLPPSFPFEESDLIKLQVKEKTVRACLRRLAMRYDEIIHTATKPDDTKGGAKPLPKFDLKQRLSDLWREKVNVAAKQFGDEMVFQVTFIPEAQNAIDGWLQALAQAGLTGAGPWHKVELVTDTEKGKYGYLNVIRTDGPNLPGIGIGAWLGERKAQPLDLRQRISFFKSNPCPVKTLVMLRADGENALNAGQTKEEYDKARKAGRDVRIHKYEPRHFHELAALAPWLQVATAELENAKEADPGAEVVFRAFLGEISKEWLKWVDNWRQPVGSKS